MPTALVTGIGGQDGAYLAKFLLDRGYRVVGGLRRNSPSPPPRLQELGVAGAIELVTLDLAEMTGFARLIEKLRPDEIYNLAAESSVALSFEQPVYTTEINAVSPLRMLVAAREAVPTARFFQASSSEMFGKTPTTPQDETTAFDPCTPYGNAKRMAHSAVMIYRESYGLKASSGIMYNHESPLRGQQFVTRKITLGLARIRHGRQEVLELGDLDSRRDWGFAGDYIGGMWRILQHEPAEDFVLATGKAHTVRHFVEVAAEHLGFAIIWHGQGREECGVDRRSGRVIVRMNPRLYRPADAAALVGNPGKARDRLGWQPIVEFDELVGLMAEADDRRVRDNAVLL